MVRFHRKARSERGRILYILLDIAIFSLILDTPLVLILGYLIPGPNYPTTIYAFEQSIVQVVDWRLFATLVIAEVPIGVSLWIILERNRATRQQTQDAISRLDSMNEYRHLKVHRVNDWVDADYPLLVYYVINMKTKHAYYAQEEIYRLEKDGIIEATKYHSKEDLDDFLSKEKITLERRNPKVEELF